MFKMRLTPSMIRSRVRDHLARLARPPLDGRKRRATVAETIQRRIGAITKDGSSLAGGHD